MQPVTLLAIAHRAGNDLPALRAALDAGAEVLEADVHRYRGRLELRHSKALRPLPLLWEQGEPLATTREPRLLLPELLTELPPHALLMLDLKGPGSVGRHVAQALHELWPDRPVMVCSRWWPGVAAASRLPYVRPLLTARTPSELRLLRRRVRSGPVPYGVSLHRSLLDPVAVAELRERVQQVLTWGIDHERDLDDVLSRGVTGVISDSPDVLAQVRGLRRS